MSKPSSRARRSPYHTTSIVGSLLATAGLVIVLGLVTNWPALLIWLTAVNLTTLAMFGVDKASARVDGPRIPELVLHVFTLLGGFLGQLLGRAVFRHKVNFRRHPLFTIILIASAALWLIIIYAVYYRG